MRHLLVHKLYGTFGHRSGYWLVMAAAQGAAASLASVVAVLLGASFLSPSPVKLTITVAVEAACTFGAVLLSTAALRPRLKRFREWRETPEPAPADTAEVWALVVNGTAQVYRFTAARTILLALIPMLAMIGWYWDAGINGALAQLAMCISPAYYATVVSFSISELLTRPMATEIASKAPTIAVYQRGFSLAQRVRIAVPAYTIAAATLTVALLGVAHGPGALAATALVALCIGVVLSTELTVLLSEAVTVPMLALRRHLETVEGGDYGVRTPVVTSDEFGELAHHVNSMTRGLAEREAVREAFNTYVDDLAAELILSGDLVDGGVEMDVSILFCDVRGFTTWAEHRQASEVVATLNEVFALAVPLVTQHGGHVDKFLGDGLMAVFGGPGCADHADRALDAARGIVQSVNRAGFGLAVACGINSGPVIAGPLGGAGRLNFSVIGDAVNVAARVEGATRETGDDILLTDETRMRFLRDHPLEARGTIELKGRTSATALFTPAVISHDV